MRRSTLFKTVEQALASESKDFKTVATEILDDGGNADDVMFEVRKLTNVPLGTRTVQRWIDALVGSAA